MPESNQIKWRGIRPVDPAENIPVDLKANSAGTINVAEQNKTGYTVDVRYQGQLNRADTYSGTGTDVFSASQAFAGTCFEIIVIAEINGAIIQLSDDNINWTEDLHVPANVMAVFTLTATHWKIKNRTAGSNVTYKVSGLFKA